MRGADSKREAKISYVSPDARVPVKHPLRPIHAMISDALTQMDGRFEKRYSQTGRPSIAPEQLIRALVLQVLYSIRSEQLLIEQLKYNLLVRWFVGLSVDEPVWDHSTSNRNRDRLVEADIARELFEAVIEQARMADLLSDEHFSVDGTLIAAWASHKRAFDPRTALAALVEAVAAMTLASFAVSGTRTIRLRPRLTLRQSCTKGVPRRPRIWPTLGTR